MRIANRALPVPTRQVTQYSPTNQPVVTSSWPCGVVWEPDAPRRALLAAVGIECYQCDGSRDFGCGELFHRERAHRLGVVSKPCSHVHNAQYCIKTTGLFAGTAAVCLGFARCTLGSSLFCVWTSCACCARIDLQMVSIGNAFIDVNFLNDDF